MEKKINAKAPSNCESCEYYDYDEFTESYSCLYDLDEDEYYRFIEGHNKSCPYYKYYDEYATVRKQN